MTKVVSSVRAGLFIAILVAVGVFAIATIADTIFLAQKVNPTWWLLVHVVLGIFAGSIVLAYHWRSHRDLRDKLTAIHELNHQIRNQLEVIEYSAWATHDQQHMERIDESVQRIERALREILGREEDEQETSPPAPEPVASKQKVARASQ